MFDYKQRPFSRKLTDEEYNRAVGRHNATTFTDALEVLACPPSEIPTGHMCNGTYKTFARHFCLFCQGQDEYPQIL